MKNKNPLIMKMINAVQISMTLSMTYDDFWNNNQDTQFVDRMCAVLNIDPTRLRIVDVKRGSAIINYEILEELSPPVIPIEQSILDPEIIAIYQQYATAAKNLSNSIANNSNVTDFDFD